MYQEKQEHVRIFRFNSASEILIHMALCSGKYIKLSEAGVFIWLYLNK